MSVPLTHRSATSHTTNASDDSADDADDSRMDDNTIVEEGPKPVVVAPMCTAPKKRIDKFVVACQKGDLKRVAKYVKKGLNNSALDQNGNTALHCAARAGQSDVCALLLQMGAQVNFVNSAAQTAQMVATFDMNNDFIESNVQKGRVARAATSQRTRRLLRPPRKQGDNITPDHSDVEGGEGHPNLDDAVALNRTNRSTDATVGVSSAKGNSKPPLPEGASIDPEASKESSAPDTQQRRSRFMRFFKPMRIGESSTSPTHRMNEIPSEATPPDQSRLFQRSSQHSSLSQPPQAESKLPEQHRLAPSAPAVPALPPSHTNSSKSRKTTAAVSAVSATALSVTAVSALQQRSDAQTLVNVSLHEEAVATPQPLPLTESDQSHSPASEGSAAPPPLATAIFQLFVAKGLRCAQICQLTHIRLRILANTLAVVIFFSIFLYAVIPSNGPHHTPPPYGPLPSHTPYPSPSRLLSSSPSLSASPTLSVSVSASVSETLSQSKSQSCSGTTSPHLSVSPEAAVSVSVSSQPSSSNSPILRVSQSSSKIPSHSAVLKFSKPSEEADHLTGWDRIWAKHWLALISGMCGLIIVSGGSICLIVYIRSQSEHSTPAKYQNLERHHKPDIDVGAILTRKGAGRPNPGTFGTGAGAGTEGGGNTAGTDRTPAEMFNRSSGTMSGGNGRPFERRVGSARDARAVLGLRGQQQQQSGGTSDSGYPPPPGSALEMSDQMEIVPYGSDRSSQQPHTATGTADGTVRSLFLPMRQSQSHEIASSWQPTQSPQPPQPPQPLPHQSLHLQQSTTTHPTSPFPLAHISTLKSQPQSSSSKPFGFNVRPPPSPAASSVSRVSSSASTNKWSAPFSDKNSSPAPSKNSGYAAVPHNFGSMFRPDDRVFDMDLRDIENRSHTSTISLASVSIAPPPSVSACSEGWMSDSASDVCLLCHSAFGPHTKKHHCHGCGRLVCGACSTGSAPIGEGGRMLRVCDRCYHASVTKGSVFTFL